MKPKHPFHHIPLTLLGIPFLYMSPSAHGQNQAKDEQVVEVVETEQTEEEKVNERRVKETAHLAKEAAKLAKEATERAKEAAEEAKATNTEEEKNKATQAKKAAERANEVAELAKKKAEHAKEASERGKERSRRAKEASEKRKEMRDEAKPAVREKPPERVEAGDKPDAPAPLDRGRGRRERPTTPVQPPTPPTEEIKPLVDMPVVPSERRKPREEMKPRDNREVPTKEKSPPVGAPDEVADLKKIEIPTTEPERQAETEVTEVAREVQRDLDQRKTRIEGNEQAQALIDDILGAESRISRAEITREERYRPRLERQRPGEERPIEVSPDQRREATSYFQERLHGREVDGPPPEFFNRSDRRGYRRDRRVEEYRVEQVELVRPRYLNEGRRYVHFDTRAAIPAILMAAQAMNEVRFQPTREIAPIFYDHQDLHASHAMPLPPENYRSNDSWVVSYPVDENSMITSEDILFLQGSTQFSDPYSYEVVGALADAMKNMPEDERFVIEGHASAEGSYDSNMTLSQQRAETIVRAMVRRGVSPYRLLPVGYGESEARHPADAAEPLRSRDRRVVVFRMKPELVAER